MMKKKFFAVLGTASILALATACSPQKAPETTAVETAAESAAETADETETAATAEKAAEAGQTEESSEKAAEGSQAESSVSGTICEIKDFMFTVETDSAAYAFSFDPKNPPADLKNVKDGDSVTVTYSGELSEMDVFEGTIVSIKKAK